ncbi:MAG: COX15/CtaA family protein [Crocinitomicaceae bacterium]|nr:COX15/CtaA family protein [Crocinitomicaceae bacterium]
MNTPGKLLLFAKISLIAVYIVIVAGSIVRVTGSGMGCPDWPTCFGYLVPPANAEVITFREGKIFNPGQMVILNDTLWVASVNITAKADFDRSQWKKYEKHDHAEFNPAKTWTEYINRLCTAFFVIPVIAMSILAYSRYRKMNDAGTLLLSLGTLLLIGFEAWLGKLVVDGNLSVDSITLHMIGSLGIIIFLVAIIYRIQPGKTEQSFGTMLKAGLWLSLLLTFLQILLGTQVREEIDLVTEIVADRSQWIEMMPVIFKVHRSFSILVVLVCCFIYYSMVSQGIKEKWINWMIAITVFEIVAGVILAYFSMPSLMQPVHLLFAVVLFGIQVHLLIISGKRVKPI